jgi:hypothetical protein
MDPFQTSRLVLDAAVVVAIDALLVVMVAAARLLAPWPAAVACGVAVAVVVAVIVRLRRHRSVLEALAISASYVCDTAPHDTSARMRHL